MSTPQLDDWDTIAPTTDRAVVAKTLRERHPGRPLEDYVGDAGAILDALGDFDVQHHAAPRVDPQPETWPTTTLEMELTALQQIRIEVFRGLLGDGAWPETDVDPMAFFGDFASAAAPFVEWIRTGVEPAPPVAADGAAAGGDVLWAVHVAGPDDVIPMPDRATADLKAAEVNGVAQALRERPDASSLDPHLSASVIKWDGTPEEHAKALAEEIAEGEYLP